MTVYDLLLIILWILVAILCITVLVLTFFYGRYTVKDNPDKAYIFRKTGRHVSKPFRAKRMGKPSRLGTKYKYGNSFVTVPNTYADVYINQRRMIFVNNIGQIIASPFDTDIELSDKEKEDLLYEMVESHIGSDAMKAIKGKNTMPIIVIIIIAFIIGILAVYGYNYIQDAMVQRQAQSQQQQQPPKIKIVPQ